jgi:hypothetical protein
MKLNHSYINRAMNWQHQPKTCRISIIGVSTPRALLVSAPGMLLVFILALFLSLPAMSADSPVYQQGGAASATTQMTVRQGVVKPAGNHGEPTAVNNYGEVQTQNQPVAASGGSTPASGPDRTSSPQQTSTGTPVQGQATNVVSGAAIDYGEVQQGGRVGAWASSANASLSGKILDPAGLSVANITVKAVKGSETLESQTDGSGNYQFALSNGTWSVSAADLDYDITPSQKVYQVQGYNITRIE